MNCLLKNISNKVYNDFPIQHNQYINRIGEISMKKKFSNNSGYSLETAKEYIDVNGECFVVEDAQIVSKYDESERKYTDEFSHVKVKLVQKDSEIFVVKIEAKVEAKQGDIVTLKNVEACEIRRDVYFKAENIAKKGHVNVFGE